MCYVTLSTSALVGGRTRVTQISYLSRTLVCVFVTSSVYCKQEDDHVVFCLRFGTVFFVHAHPISVEPISLEFRNFPLFQALLAYFTLAAFDSVDERPVHIKVHVGQALVMLM